LYLTRALNAEVYLHEDCVDLQLTLPQSKTCFWKNKSVGEPIKFFGERRNVFHCDRRLFPLLFSERKMARTMRTDQNGNVVGGNDQPAAAAPAGPPAAANLAAAPAPDPPLEWVVQFWCLCFFVLVVWIGICSPKRGFFGSCGSDPSFPFLWSGCIKTENAILPVGTIDLSHTWCHSSLLPDRNNESETAEQDDVAPDENIGYGLLYLDGNTVLKFTFDNKQASENYIYRMSCIKEQASLVHSKLTWDEMRPVLTSEFRKEANRFLEMVASAAEGGFFIPPSIISSQAELVALIDENGWIDVDVLWLETRESAGVQSCIASKLNSRNSRTIKKARKSEIARILRANLAKNLHTKSKSIIFLI
jgi:hypothetical protein